MAELPPLPDGFILDQRAKQDAPPLPEGFVMDGQQAPQGEQSKYGNRYVDRFMGGVDALADGLTFGVAPYIRGITRGAITDQTMGEGIAQERADQEKRRTEQPVSTFINEAGGGMLSGGGLVGAGISATRMLPTTGSTLAQRSAAIGTDAAAMGAVSAASEGRDPGMGALAGFGIGAGGNAVLEKGAGALAKALRRKQIAQTARPYKDVKGEVDDAYNAFRGENVAYNPQWAQRTAQEYEQELQKQALSRGMAPAAHSAYDDLTKVAGSGDAVSAEWVENLRKSLSRASTNKMNPNEAYASGRGADVLARAIRGAQQGDVAAGGNAQKAAQALDAGRAAHIRSLKADEIRKVMETAQGGYASGDANAMRLGLRGIIRKAARNKQFAKLWSKDELEAIRNAADGGPIDNILRQFGKMGFASVGQGSNGLGGVLGGVAGGGVGAAIGGAVGGYPGAMVGSMAGSGINTLAASGARRLSDANMATRMRLIEAMMTQGKNLPAPGPTQQLLMDERIKMLLADALAGGVTAGPN